MDSTLSHLLRKDKTSAGHIFPFLWLHGEREEILRKYMRVIHEAHIDAVCVESRPHPDFLGPKWWKDMDAILDEARKRGMRVWILDDSHFPTGYANGALEHADPSLCRQSLVYRVLGTVNGGERLHLSLSECASVPDWTPNLMEQYSVDTAKLRRFSDDRLLGVVAARLEGSGSQDILDLSEQVQAGEWDFTAPEGQWRVYALNLTRNRGPHRNYINMMSRASCKVLLDTVYEAHWQHYREDFGKTIAGFFSDEPEIGNGHLYESGKRFWEIEDLAWSDEVESRLRATFGQDFVKWLPLLWEQAFDGRRRAYVRDTYMDIVTKAVCEDFSQQIGSWCRAHGVEYIGHLIEDNNQHLRCGSSLGHYFRGLAGQDMAGIDCIGGQVLPQGEWDGPYGLMGEHRSGLFYHFVLGKLGASLAAIDPNKKGRCMCEIFGNYGWKEGVRLEKYLADHFLVRGVNYFVPHAFSPKAYPDPDCPPHFYAHGHNPQYRHFGALMQYMGRLSRLFSGGKQDAPVAILYTAESDWAGDCMNLETVAQPLAENQIDYHFVPADVFSQRDVWSTQFQNGLHINGQHYRALLIPGCDFIPDSVAEVLPELTACGCSVFFAGRRSDCIKAAVDLSRFPVEDVTALPGKLRALGIPAPRLEPANFHIRCMRYLAQSERYFFVNEGTETYTGAIHLPTKGPCYAYNAWDNRLEIVKSCEEESGTALYVTIVPGKSLLVLFDDPDVPVLPPVAAAGTCEVWNTGWIRGICKAIEYPAFRDSTSIILPDALASEQPLFSGFVRYEKGFFWDNPGKQAVLEITDAEEAVEVFVNDRSLGIQIAAPFLYDLTDALVPGENRIRIEVATTLERETSTLPDMIRTYLGLGAKQPTCPSGIHGEVRLWKK